MTLAVPVATMTGISVRALISTRRISDAKITPPIGVLKVAAIPAPPPAAMKVSRCHSVNRIHPASIEPNVAPIWMIGPSRPMEPPEPIEIDEASALTAATCGRIRPLLKWIASMTSGTPWPLASGAKCLTR